jgi:chaperone BCS1
MALHAPQQTATGPTGIAGLRSMLKGKTPMSLRSHELAVETAFKQHENGSSEAVFNLVPGPGVHYFRYKGSWFQVSLETATSDGGGCAAWTRC